MSPDIEKPVRLDPNAPHPPFPWQIALPNDWAFLDTNPATWQRSASGLVDETFAGQRLRTSERKQLLDVLADLVAQAQASSTCLSLVRLGLMSNGELGSAGLHLAWYNSEPETASLSLARRAAARQAIVNEVQSDAGPMLLAEDRISLVPPRLERRVTLTSVQAFLPLPERTWTAVVASAGVQPTMIDMLRDLVVAVAGTIEPVDSSARPKPGSPTPAPAPSKGDQFGPGNLGRRIYPGGENQT